MKRITHPAVVLRLRTTCHVNMEQIDESQLKIRKKIDRQYSTIATPLRFTFVRHTCSPVYNVMVHFFSRTR